MTSVTYCYFSDLGWLSFWLKVPDLSLHSMIVCLACGSLESQTRILSFPKFLHFFASALWHRMRSRSNGPFNLVWSKIDSFQECIVMSKVKAISMLTRWLLDINKSFKMRYFINFSLNGLQNYQKLNFRLPNLLHKRKIFCNY